MLKRYAGTPSLQALRQFALRHLTGMIPKGFKWFSRMADRASWQLGRLLRAFAVLFGLMKGDVERVKAQVFLSGLSGAELLKTAELMGITPFPGESDDDLAIRLADELTADKLTANALESMVERLTNGLTGADVFEPAQQIMYTDSLLDGSYALTDQRYYHGGVFELRVDRVIPFLEDYVRRYRAAGTWPVLVIAMDDRQPDNNDPDAIPGYNLVGAELILLEEAQVAVSPEDEVSGAEEVLIQEDETGPGQILTGTMQLFVGRLSANVLLVADKDTWATTGVPVYNTLRTPYLDVRDRSDLQPGLDYELTGAVLGGGNLLGDEGLELG